MALMPTTPDPPAGSASGFYTGLLDTKHQLETNDQNLSDRLTDTITGLFGNGVVAGSYTPPILAAGTGLTVNVAGLTALIGFLFVEASGVVTVPASSTSHIYLYQDGTFDHNTSGTNPGTSDNPAIELGTATTDGSGVTSVTVTAPIVGGGIVPIGFIGMWSGAVVDIPANWHLCDGTNGTPDLRDKFIVGAGSTYSPGGTGGAATHSHTVNSHSHTVNSHSHSQSANTGTGNASIPAHSAHTHIVDAGGSTFTLDILPTSDTTTLNYTSGGSSLSLPIAGHDHGWNAGGNVGDPNITLSHTDAGHTHPLGGSTGSSSPGTDSQSPGTNSASSLPPYLALAFIQRIA